MLAAQAADLASEDCVFAPDIKLNVCLKRKRPAEALPAAPADKAEPAAADLDCSALLSIANALCCNR